MDEVGRFYKAKDHNNGTHIALRWNGRLRFTVPREASVLKVCFKTFHPGWKEVPLRAMALLQRILGAQSCVEDARLKSIREAIGNEAGLSCCRAGAPGIWSKDTILFLDKRTAEPLYIVKAGCGDVINSLLRNEANWLRTLRDQKSLIAHIPELIAHCSGKDLSFVAEYPLPGKIDHNFGELHIEFLRKLQECSRQTMRFEESRLYLNLRSRLKDLSGLLSKAWSTRLDRGMQRIEHSLLGRPLLLVAAHNDFIPWNIRVERGVARVFDWEYADYEQLPLFDPLHFVLMPMALWSRSTAMMVQSMNTTLQLGRQWLAKESCYEAQTQALAYLMNICTLYLWRDRGISESHLVVESYSKVIDHILLSLHPDHLQRS